MKTSFLSTVVLAIVASGALGTPVEERSVEQRSADIDFASSCSSISLNTSDAVLTASCENTAGTSKITSSISLNSCIANSNGQLVAKSGGDFSASCSSLSFSDSGGNPVLSARCPNTAGSETFSSSIDLNSVLSNSNGHLTCP